MLYLLVFRRLLISETDVFAEYYIMDTPRRHGSFRHYFHRYGGFLIGLPFSRRRHYRQVFIFDIFSTYAFFSSLFSYYAAAAIITITTILPIIAAASSRLLHFRAFIKMYRLHAIDDADVYIFYTPCRLLIIDMNILFILEMALFSHDIRRYYREIFITPNRLCFHADGAFQHFLYINICIIYYDDIIIYAIICRHYIFSTSRWRRHTLLIRWGDAVIDYFDIFDTVFFLLDFHEYHWPHYARYAYFHFSSFSFSSSFSQQYFSSLPPYQDYHLRRRCRISDFMIFTETPSSHLFPHAHLPHWHILSPATLFNIRYR